MTFFLLIDSNTPPIKLEWVLLISTIYTHHWTAISIYIHNVNSSYIANKKTATTEYGAYVYCLLSAAYSSTLPHCCAVEGRDKLSALCPLALWVNLVTLPLVLFQVAIIAFVASVLPFGKVNNVMLIELALTCLVNVFSLLFTLLAHGAWCSCHVASTFHDPLLWHYSCHSRFSHLTRMQRRIIYHHLLMLLSLLYFLAWSSSSWKHSFHLMH